MKTTKTSLLLLSTLFAAALSAAASDERINRDVAAHPGGKLVLDVDFGNVDVSPGADDKVAVEAFRSIDFGNEAKEKEYLAAAAITITADANTVIVRTHAPAEARRTLPNHTRMDARYTVRVPKNFSADLSTGGGAIAASQLSGDLRANSGGGDLHCSHVRGTVSAQSGGGSVDLNECSGTVEITTGGGDIVCTAGNGSLHACTGGGTIEVRDFRGDTKASSGGGQLTLERIDGAISGETAGGSIAASFAGSALKKITLVSSGGDIDLVLSKAAAADISAETGAGRITTDLPLEITSTGDEHLRGKLNGGGAAIRLRTNGGSIRINSSGGATVSR
jgi:hypothetical protein